MKLSNPARSNIGWVNMGSGTPADGIHYSNAAAGDCGVNFTASATPGVAVMRGFAYGASNLAEALAGTDSQNPADALRITAFAYEATGANGTATLTFTSGTTRLYRIEQREDLISGEWHDSGLGSFFWRWRPHPPRRLDPPPARSVSTTSSPAFRSRRDQPDPAFARSYEISTLPSAFRPADGGHYSSDSGGHHHRQSASRSPRNDRG